MKANSFSILCFLVFQNLVCGFSYAIETTVFRISTEEYPPYTSRDMMHDGIDAHIVTEAFALENIRVEFTYYPGARSFALAKNGTFDGTLPWAKRLGREQSFLYSDPIMTVNHAHFYFLRGSKFNWDNNAPDYNDIKGKTVAAIIGHDYGKDFQQAEADGIIYVERISKPKQAFWMMLQGRVDLFISNEKVANYNLHAYFSEEEIGIIDHIATENSPLGYDYLLISKKLPQAKFFQESLNRGLKKLHDSGKYDAYLNNLAQGKYVLHGAE